MFVRQHMWIAKRYGRHYLKRLYSLAICCGHALFLDITTSQIIWAIFWWLNWRCYVRFNTTHYLPRCFDILGKGNSLFGLAQNKKLLWSHNDGRDVGFPWQQSHYTGHANLLQLSFWSWKVIFHSILCLFIFFIFLYNYSVHSWIDQQR